MKSEKAYAAKLLADIRDAEFEADNRGVFNAATVDPESPVFGRKPDTGIAHRAGRRAATKAKIAERRGLVAHV